MKPCKVNQHADGVHWGVNVSGFYELLHPLALRSLYLSPLHIDVHVSYSWLRLLCLRGLWRHRKQWRNLTAYLLHLITNFQKMALELQTITLEEKKQNSLISLNIFTVLSIQSYSKSNSLYLTFWFITRINANKLLNSSELMKCWTINSRYYVTACFTVLRLTQSGIISEIHYWK